MKIITDQGTGHQSMKLLACLAERDSAGRYVTLSAEELADAIGATHVGVITGCVKTVRDNAVKRLGKIGITVGRDDVIRHDQVGYSLPAWITVRDRDTPACPSHVPAGPAIVPVNVPGVPANVPARPELNTRQLWILEQLNQGLALQRVMVESHFGVGAKTAKRDLSELTQHGLIEYRRRGRDGCYRTSN